MIRNGMVARKMWPETALGHLGSTWLHFYVRCSHWPGPVNNGHPPPPDLLNQNLYMPEHLLTLLISILNMKTAPTSEKSSILPTSIHENDCEIFVGKFAERKPVGGTDASRTNILYFDVCVRNSRLSDSSIVFLFLNITLIRLLDVTICSLVDGYQRFGGISFLSLKVRMISSTLKMEETSYSESIYSSVILQGVNHPLRTIFLTRKCNKNNKTKCEFGWLQWGAACFNIYFINRR